MHRKFVSKFKIFFKIYKIWNSVSIFFRFLTQENVCWGPVTFLPVLYLQYFTDLFTILKMFHKLSPMLHKS